MIVKNGYIIAVQPHDEQYNVLCDIVANKPKDPDNYRYQLRADTLEWELAELPPEPEPSAPTDDEALTRYANELTNGNVETLQEATENLIKIVKEDK